MAARKTAQKIAQEIAIGGHDAELKEILTASTSRMIELGLQQMWRIDLDDIHFTEEDITIGQMLEVEKFSGKPWFAVGDPWMQMESRIDWLGYLFMTMRGLSEDEARAQAAAVKLTATAKAFSRYVPADHAPKDEG